MPTNMLLLFFLPKWQMGWGPENNIVNGLDLGKKNIWPDVFKGQGIEKIWRIMARPKTSGLSLKNADKWVHAFFIEGKPGPGTRCYGPVEGTRFWTTNWLGC